MGDSKKKLLLEYSCWFIFVGVIVFFTFIEKRLSFVLRDDGYNQYFPVFTYTGRYYRSIIVSVFSGQKVPIYDFSIGLGGDILTYLNKYGITDIFNVVFSIVCPAKYSVYGYSLAMLAKMYFAGITFLIYCRYRGFEQYSSIIGALSYSFCTFALAYGLAFPEFMFPLVTLPIFILGIDSILDGRCSRNIYILLTFSIFIQALTGFYMLYMETIFCAVWLVSRIAFCRRNKIVLKLLKIVWVYIISIGLAAFVLYPVILLFLSSTRNGNSGISIHDLFAFYSGDSLASRFSSFALGQWGMGLGISVIGVIAIYSIVRCHNDKHLLFMTIFSIGCYFNSGTGLVTNGFSYSVDRYIFLIYFVIGLVIAEQIPNIHFIGYEFWLFFSTYIFVWTFCTIKFVTDSRGSLTNRVLVFIVSSVVCALLIILCSQNDTRVTKIISKIACILSICIIGAIYNMPFKYGGVGWYEMFMYYKQPYESIIYSQYGEAANKVQSDTNDDFKRIDVGEASIGSSLFTSTYSTSLYLSIIDPYQFDFYSKYGLSSSIKSDFTLQKLDGRKLIQKVLSVKYYTENDIAELEENESYYSLGQVFTTYITESDAADYNVIDKNYLVDKIVILDDECSLSKYRYDIDCSELVQFTRSDNNVIYSDDYLEVNENSTIDIRLEEVDLDSEYYICLYNFITEDYMHDVTIADKEIRLRQVDSYYGQDENIYVRVSAEYLQKNKGSVSITFNEEGKYTLKNIEVRKIKIGESTSTSIENEGTLNDVEFNGREVAGTTSLENEGILFMSIPYSLGWKCYIDGVETHVYKADYGFIAAIVPAGDHSIIWKYNTPGKEVGVIVSIICFLLFGVSIRGIYENNKKNK